ncbi:MAG: glycine oxidase [Thermoleophilaceae bacterium]|jgi:glycine oxidase|nr:glycine oxidase [Thermoleophilaceae bacterium]
MQAAPERSEYDVVVVGAGVIGLACAWRLAERGLTVCVLERDAPGAGASGVAAGMLAPVTEAEFGEGALLDLNLAAARAWPAFAATLGERTGTAVGYEQGGALVVAADRDDAAELRRLHDFQRSLGLEVEWLTASAARRLEPALAPRIAGAIHAPHEAQADPRAVVRALRDALCAAGGEVVTGVEVAALRDHGVETSAGPLAAAHVVAAAGAWSGALAGAPPVRPVKGQIVRLRRRPGTAPLASRLVRTPRCYVVDRSNGEIVVGATVEDRGFDTQVTADGVFRLLEAAYEVLPDIGELDWVEAGARLRPGTPDNAPAIGRGSMGGLIWATGHFRNGILLAPVTADAVAAIVAGGDPGPAMLPFAPDRFAAMGSAAR